MAGRAVVGEVVVITGASAGIGRATVREFARHGASIALIAREPIRLEEARAEAQRLGAPAALAISADMADHAQVEAAAEQVERTLGPIDIWVNNAMATIFAPVRDIAPEDFRRVTDVTYHGFVWGTMAALKRMRQRNCGAIVQVSSALAYRSIPLQSPYCGAKHAIKGVQGQQGSRSIAPDRPDNLWRPVPGPYAAHGSFDRDARTISVQFWATAHRGWLLAGAGALAAALGLYRLRRQP